MIINDHFMKKTQIGAAHSANLIFEFANKNKYNIETVLDIGANIGIHTILYSLNWPMSKIHSFEPILENYEEIVKNISMNKINNVKVNNFGIYSENCEKYLAIPLDRDENNTGLYSIKIDGKNKKKCKFKTIENYLTQEKINKADFVKIDAEGCELDILRSCPSFFSKVKLISIEINASFGDVNLIKDLLGKYGYIYKLSLDRVTELWENKLI